MITKAKDSLYSMVGIILFSSLFSLVGCGVLTSGESSTRPASEEGSTQMTSEIMTDYPYEAFAGIYSCVYTMPASEYNISTEVGDRTFIRIWSDNTAVFMTEMLSSTYYCDATYVFSDNVYVLTLFYGDTMHLVLDLEKNELTSTDENLYYEGSSTTTYAHLQTGTESGIRYYEDKAGLDFVEYIMTNISYTEYSVEMVYTLKNNGTGNQRFYSEGTDLMQYFTYESSFGFEVQHDVISFSLTKTGLNFMAEYVNNGFVVDLTLAENHGIAEFYSRIMGRTTSPVGILTFAR